MTLYKWARSIQQPSPELAHLPGVATGEVVHEFLRHGAGCQDHSLTVQRKTQSQDDPVAAVASEAAGVRQAVHLVSLHARRCGVGQRPRACLVRQVQHHLLRIKARDLQPHPRWVTTLIGAEAAL